MASNDNNNNNTWPADVKNAEGRIDPHVLPEYTLLPASPAQSVVSYNTANDDDPEAARPSALPSSTHTHTHTNTNTNASANASLAAESPTIAKLLYMGALALAVPPLLCALAALVAAAMGLYGCGKILEGTGRALAFAPEWAYRGGSRSAGGRSWGRLGPRCAASWSGGGRREWRGRSRWRTSRLGRVGRFPSEQRWNLG